MRKFAQQKLHLAVILDLEWIVLSDLNHKHGVTIQKKYTTQIFFKK